MTVRRLLTLLIGASLPLLWSTAAFAHAVLQPAGAPAGQATEFQVLIPHGCSEGEPPPPPGVEVANTRLVSVEIPEGVTVESAADAEGFTPEVTDTEVTWSGGDLENGDPGQFFFTATLDGADGDEITFPVYQECTDELDYRWTGAPDDPTPAPVVTVGGDAEAGMDHSEHGGEDGEHGGEDGEHAMEEMADGEEMAMEEGEEHATEEMGDGEGTAEEDPADEETAEEVETAEEPTEEQTTEGPVDDDTNAPTGAPATGAGGSGGSTTLWVLAGLGVVAAGAVTLVTGRRRA